MLFIEYDPDAEAIFVRFSELGADSVAGVRVLDDRRNLHLAHGGEVVGVEFLDVRSGIALDGVPRADEIAAALAAFPRLAA